MRRMLSCDDGIWITMSLLRPASIVIVLGPGGVGKTTVAAALGTAAAMAGIETAVITVDPARRLRDALGLSGGASRPTYLDRRRLSAAGLDPELRLAVMSLDVKATWDKLVQRFIADPASQQQIFDNSFYRNLTERFTGAESYAALELLQDLYEQRRFAFEVVDTPPATHAFDFIEGPDHLARLLDSKTGRWLARLTAAARRPALSLGGRTSRMIIEQLEQVTGAPALSAIADFLAATAGAADAIRQRMCTTAALLRSPAVTFALVTTAAEDRLQEATVLAQQMKAAGLRLRLVVINRLTDQPTFDRLQNARSHTAELLRAVAAWRSSLSAGDYSSGAAEVVAYLEDYLREQAAALDRVARFRRVLPARTAVLALPEIAEAARGLGGIARLAAILSVGGGADLVAAAADTAIRGAPRGRSQRSHSRRVG